MAQVQKRTTRPAMKRKKPAKNNNTLLLAAGFGVIVLIGIVYAAFLRSDGSPDESGVTPLSERKYGRTALRKHPGIKKLELSNELKKAGNPPELVELHKRHIRLLDKMEDVR